MASDRKKVDILLVDDEPDIVALMTEFLSDDFPELNLVGFTDPLCAIEFAKTADIHTIITDAMMPGMGGEALIRAIRGDSLHHDIIVTGYAIDEPKPVELGSPIMNFGKPVNWTTLKEYIRCIFSVTSNPIG